MSEWLRLYIGTMTLLLAYLLLVAFWPLHS